MSLIASAAGQPTWISVASSASFRAAPGPGEFAAAAAAPGTVFILPGTLGLPNKPMLVRGVSFSAGNAADPIVMTGALQLAIGILYLTPATIVTAFLTNRNLAGWNGRTLHGAGVDVNTTYGSGETGVIALAPAAAYGPGSLARGIAAITDAGTATGTIYYRFQYRLL